jgi:hypothetical protein
MLPYWIELSISDLMQGTGFAAMAFILFTLQFFMPAGRA